jgi:hypothetical protein
MGNLAAYNRSVKIDLKKIEVGSVVPCGIVKRIDPIELTPWDEVMYIGCESSSDGPWINIQTKNDGTFMILDKDLPLINFNNRNCKCFEDTQSSR